MFLDVSLLFCPEISLMTNVSSSVPSFAIGVNKHVLDNGLTVLIKESHTAPVVSVQVWYRVGARNEELGINGIAHQLEHLMFKGTHSRPIQFGRLFSALGSASNAFTSYDMTAYYGTAGREKLEALLVLEADRMANALMTAEQLASEKRVVISELQGYENSPEYRLSRLVMQKAFPDHPYGCPVGGTKADVEQLTLAQVQAFYRCYYQPKNAVLVVAGDLATASVFDRVQEIFGTLASLPVGATPDLAVSATPRFLESPQSEPLYLREPGSASLLQAIYPLPAFQHADVPAIDVMDAILSSGRSSRLYQALVDTGLASHASAYSAMLIEPGWYDLSVTVSPEQSLTQIERILQQTIESLQQSPVTLAELQRAKTQLISNFILGNREIEHQASQLAYSQLVAGDYRYSDRYLAAIEQVTVADVQRVTQRYLDQGQRTLGFFEPTQVSGPTPQGLGAVKQTSENFLVGEPEDPDAVAQYLPPLTPASEVGSQRLPQRLVLANGLRVLLFPDQSTPTVTLSGYLQAGTEFDGDQAGLAALTADLLMSGTHSHDEITLAKVLEDRGASLDLQAFREGVDIEGYALSQDLATLLQVLAEVLQQAAFPQDKFELIQQRTQADLSIELDDPGRMGFRVLQTRIYPNHHPFHGFATVESVAAITRTDVLNFYQTYYGPEQTTLALVGDFKVEQVSALLKEIFGGWSSTAEPALLDFPEIKDPPTIDLIQVALPGKHQAITCMGHHGIDRQDSRYYAMLLLNQILGGDTLSSRLGTEIRDRQGLTYGIYSYFAVGVHAGPFVIQMQTSPADTQQAIESTLALLQNFRDQGITAAELQTAKRSLINSYPVELSSPDILVQRLLMNEIHQLDSSEIYDFPRRLNDVTLEEVQGVIHDLIRSEALTIVTAGPPATVSA